MVWVGIRGLAGRGSFNLVSNQDLPRLSMAKGGLRLTG